MKKILTIAKKEFLSFVNQPTGYIFIVSFIAISYFLFFKQIFLLGSASIRPYILNIPILLSIIIPSLTMASIAGEKMGKTIETIITAPVSPLNIVLGKFLGLVSLYALMILVTLSIPISLSFFGSFDIGVLFASYLGILILGALFIAIGIFISALVENQILSFVLSLVVIIMLVLIGTDSVTMGLPPFVGSIVSTFGVFSRLNSFNKGVVDFRDVLYFISFTVLFLTYATLIISKDRLSKKSLLISYTTKSIFIVLLAGVVVGNFFAKSLYIRLDLTAQKIFTLSQTTRDILKKLDGNTSLYFYYSTNLPTEFSDRKDAVLDILKDFANTPQNKLKIEYKPVTSQAEEELALSDGVTPVQFNTVTNDEFQAKRGVLGLVAKNGETKEPIPFLESLDGLEYQLVTIIRRAGGEVGKKVAFLQDAKTSGLYSDLSDFRTELSKYYQPVTLSLLPEQGQKEEKSIPEDTGVIVISGPKDKLDEKVISKLTKFVDEGKALIVFADSYDVSISTLSPSENQNNINDLLKNFGVAVNKNMVFDLKYNERINLNQGFFTYVLPYPYFPRIIPTTEGKKLLGNISPILGAWPSDLEITQNDQFKHTVIAKLSNFGGKEEGTTINISPNKEFPKTDLKERNFAVLSENSKGGKVIVVSNDDLILKDFYKANQNFALNLFDLATNDKGFLAIRSKTGSLSPLNFKSEVEKNTVKYGNLIGVPLLIVLIGAGRIWLRSKNFSRKYSGN